MNIRRYFKHLMTGNIAVTAAFPARSMNVIEQAIRESESRHGGQIRFAVEAALDYSALRRNLTAGERAIEVFSQLRVWDTEHNNGVLIYLLLAEHDVEIVADRGINAKTDISSWEQICHVMETAFRDGKFEEGVVTGICEVSNHLQRHFPIQAGAINELPDKPATL